ncbi:MAG: hypothetical protein CSYNP_03452 [Syntrophus sp. SKADARSKE-3]|nr:hypothetical protein [Syntrophus sp. SKADARSKE-3]MDQ5987707.1 hypothetical protein [Syntrophus sp. SKADARSKE-3]
MKKQIKYTDEPMKMGRVVEDFLPRPKDLVLKKERVVTLRLDDSTIAELKAEAHRKGLGLSSLVRMWVLERLESTHAHS